MSRDLYSALSGAFGAWRQLEVVANNIANADTTGFKGARVTFEAQGPDGAYARVAGTLVDARSGAARATNTPTDVALQGTGWLVVDGGGSPLLTRDGHLHVDPMDGTLRTVDGFAVMGDSGPIVAPPGQSVRIDADGLVTADDGTELDRLRVVEAATEPAGGNLFRPLGPLVDAPVTLIPGALESSNVDPVRAMVELVEAGRSFETFQKVLQTSDDLDSRLNEFGRG
jgi:flagellar basal-body rod protein FlgF